MTRKIRFLIFAALTYYLPVALLLIGVIPFAYRFVVLLVMAALGGIYAAVCRLSLRELGLSTSHLRGSLIVNGLVGLVLAGAVVAAFLLHQIRPPTIPSWNWFFPFFVFVSSPAQEFLYRGLMFAELRRAGIGGAASQVAISAATYCLLHSIYRDGLTLVVTLFMGVVWGLIYRRWPNLWGVSLSHAILGVIAIVTGLI